jgi:predicted metalloprotease with PDZ domain
MPAATGRSKPAPPKIEYAISMLHPHTHCFDVEVLLKGIRSDSLSFIMPVWTPGMYFIHEFERNVQEFQAFDNLMKPLEWEKVEKNSWRVQTRGRTIVRARYRVYSHENRVDTSYLDIEHARINPASVLMHVKGFMSQPLLVKLTPYAKWRKVSTSLRPVDSGGLTFLAADYDNLVDSPIEVGNFQISGFTALGKRHDVALVGANEAAANGLVADLKRIVEAAAKVCGDLPYDRYVFLIEFTEGVSSGLEHMNSTLCRFSRFLFQPKLVYNRALGLFSHEFFHLWNVKRVRPLALGPFDYSRENYTKSLWIAEGITNYYDDLILRRAGIYTVAEYLDSLADQFSRFRATPGRKLQTAEESSFDSWVKFSMQFFRPDENSINSGVSYYNKGSILGWMIDMQTRRATGGAKSLDDIMRKVYSDSRISGRGYTDEEFQKTSQLVAGIDLSHIFENHVRGTREIEFDKYLGYAGLRLEEAPNEVDDSNPGGFLGVHLRMDGRVLLVDAVLAGTPAYRDGIYASDSVISVDGLVVDENEFAYYVRSRKPGSVVNLRVGRGGCERTLKARVGKRPHFLFRIGTKRDAGTEERRLFENWLGEPWGKIKYEEREQFPPIRAAEYLFFKPQFV